MLILLLVLLLLLISTLQMNLRTGFASCLCAFKCSGLITCLEQLPSMFLLCLIEINRGCVKILPVLGSF